MIDELYSEKTNRDVRARQLKEEGYTIRKYSHRNQLLHPMYIRDVSSGNTGFGNTEYKTFWKVLYGIEAI